MSHFLMLRTVTRWFLWRQIVKMETRQTEAGVIYFVTEWTQQAYHAAAEWEGRMSMKSNSEWRLMQQSSTHRYLSPLLLMVVTISLPRFSSLDASWIDLFFVISSSNVHWSFFQMFVLSHTLVVSNGQLLSHSHVLRRKRWLRSWFLPWLPLLWPIVWPCPVPHPTSLWNCIYPL